VIIIDLQEIVMETHYRKYTPVLAAALLALFGLNTHRALAEGDGSFSDASLRGSYSCRSATGFINVAPGVVNPPGLNVAALERLVFDGAGNLTGTETVNVIFKIVCNYSASGTYSVGADGTGSIQATQTLQPSDPNCGQGTAQNPILLVGPTADHFFMVDSSALSFECTAQH
jgi:hypothetical protein